MTFPEGEPVPGQINILWISSDDFLMIKSRQESLEEKHGVKITFRGSTKRVIGDLAIAAKANQPLPDVIVCEMSRDRTEEFALASVIKTHYNEGVQKLPICLLTLNPPTDRERAKAEELGITIREERGFDDSLETIRSLCKGK